MARTAAEIQSDIAAAVGMRTKILSGAQSYQVAGRTFQYPALEVVNQTITELQAELSNAGTGGIPVFRAVIDHD